MHPHAILCPLWVFFGPSHVLSLFSDTPTIFAHPTKGIWGAPTTLFAPPHNADNIIPHNVIFFTRWGVFFMPLPLFVGSHKCTTHGHMSVSVWAELSSPHARALTPPPSHVYIRIYSAPYHSKTPPCKPPTPTTCSLVLPTFTPKFSHFK